MVDRSYIRKTLKMDLLRNLCEGPLQAAAQGISILILIEVFSKHAPGEKFFEGLLFGSTFAGMIASFFYINLCRRLKLSTSWMLSAPAWMSGFFLLAASFSDEIYSFTILASLAFFSLPLRISILTAIYHNNYPIKMRGTFAGIGLLVYQMTTIGFYYLAGEWLDKDVSHYRTIILLLSASSFLAAWASHKIPTDLIHTETKNPFKAISWVYKDPLFGYLLLVWTIFGFANLWIQPLRITYLHEQWELGPSMVSWIVGVIPETTRLLFLPFWSIAFDRMNFILMRIALNVFIGGGIAIYFFATSLTMLGIGSLLQGIGLAGGSIAWTLWVTKMVPKERSSDYMSVHVATTGVRGFVGPFIGLYLLQNLSHSDSRYQTIGMISSLLFLLSIILLIPVIRLGKGRND